MARRRVSVSIILIKVTAQRNKFWSFVLISKERAYVGRHIRESTPEHPKRCGIWQEIGAAQIKRGADLMAAMAMAYIAGRTVVDAAGN